MVTSIDTELYICNGCGDAIGSERARILCNICVDFNLCSNCYVISFSSKVHSKSHATTVFRTSGYVNSENSNATRLSHSETHGGEQRKQSEDTERKYSEIPTANWGALWNVMRAPLVKKDKRTSKSLGKIKTGASLELRHKSELLSPFSDIPEPLLSPSLVANPQRTPEYPGPTYFRPDKWEPFFEPNNTPSSIFVGLMSSIFNIMDEKRTGFLKPEEFSNFLEIQGYPLSANICKLVKVCPLNTNELGKMACTKAAGASNKEVADLELGLFFSERSISHILTARPKNLETNNGKSSGKVTSPGIKKKKSKNVNHNMPLLSRQGFIDYCASEYLKDPSMAYQYLMNALHELKVWKELGDLPRSVLPSSPTNQDSKKNRNLSISNLDSEEAKSFKSGYGSHLVNKEKEVLQKGNDEESSKSDNPCLSSSNNQLMSPPSIQKPEVTLTTGDQKDINSIFEHPKTPIKEPISPVFIDIKEDKLIKMNVENLKPTLPNLSTSKNESTTSLFDDNPDYSFCDESKKNRKSPNLLLKPSEKEFMSPTFIENSEVTLPKRGSKDVKSAFQYLSTSEKEPSSPRFILNFRDKSIVPSDLQPRINYPSKIKCPGLLQNKQKLQIKTDFPNQWLSTASALSVKSPRKKVEMLVEAFEYVRANSICFDERPDFKDSPIYKNTTT